MSSWLLERFATLTLIPSNPHSHMLNPSLASSFLAPKSESFSNGFLFKGPEAKLRFITGAGSSPSTGVLVRKEDSLGIFTYSKKTFDLL